MSGLGAWGNGIFDNDVARNLFDDLDAGGAPPALIQERIDAWDAFRQRKADGHAPRALSADEIESLQREARQGLLANNPHMAPEALQAMAEDLLSDGEAGWDGLQVDTGSDEALGLAAAAGLLLAVTGTAMRLPERRRIAWRPSPEDAATLALRLVPALEQLGADPSLVAELGRGYLRQVGRLRDALGAVPGYTGRRAP